MSTYILLYLTTLILAGGYRVTYICIHFGIRDLHKYLWVVETWFLIVGVGDYRQAKKGCSNP